MRLSEGWLAIVELFLFFCVIFFFFKLEPLLWFRMFTFKKDVNQIAYAKKTLQWVGNFPFSNRVMSYIWHNYREILLQYSSLLCSSEYTCRWNHVFVKQQVDTVIDLYNIGGPQQGPDDLQICK